MNIRYIIYGTFLIVLASCKSLQLPTERALLKSPEQYINKTDSVNSAKINWREFFTDENFTSLIDTALQNNLDVLTALQNIEIAKANLRYSKGLLLPTVNANVGAGVTKYGNYTQEWAGNKTTEIVDGKIIPQHLPDFLLGFSSSWELDIWGKLKNKKQAAQARYWASIEGKNLLQTVLIADIANNYYELLSLDNQIDILNQNIALQEKSLELIKIQKEANRSTELAVKQFEAQILNAKGNAKLLSQVVVEIENNINLLLGRYPQSIARNKNDFDKPLLQKIQEGIPSQLLQNRPDIRIAEQELIASRFDVQVAKKSFYPSLNINAGLALQSFSPSLLFSGASAAYNILGGITAPLLNRNALMAEFKTASAVQHNALYNYQKSILNGFTEVYNQVKNIDNLNEVYALKQQEVSTLENAITYSNLLFQTNRADYLDVLMAQQNRLQAQLDLLQYKKQQQQSKVNLYRALGGGWQ